MADAADPGAASAPRRDARTCAGCALGLLLFALGLYVLGVAAGRHLTEQALPGASDGVALVEAAREVARASSLPAAEREAALRSVLARLEATREGKRTPAEQALIERVRALLGEESARAPAADEAPVNAAPAPEPVEPRIGQWVVLRETRAGEPPEVRYTFRWIAAVEADTVTIHVQGLEAEPPRLATGPAYPTFFRRGAPPAVPPGAPLEQVEAAERSWPCARTEERDRHGRTVVSWASLELPVYHGLAIAVRQVVRGREGREVVRHELFRYGASGGAERPISPAAR